MILWQQYWSISSKSVTGVNIVLNFVTSFMDDPVVHQLTSKTLPNSISPWSKLIWIPLDFHFVLDSSTIPETRIVRIARRPSSVVMISPGVNFINVFMRSFYARRSLKHKKMLDLTVFFALLGSVCVKAARKMLVTFSPRRSLGTRRFSNPETI